MKWFLARRALWTVAALYLVVSATFFVFALTPDPNRQAIAYAAAQETGPDESAVEAGAEAMEAYDEVRNRDRPLLDRYRDWMIGYATGQWGWSYTYNEPVTAVLGGALPVTLSYLVPGVLLASLLSVFAGLYGAIRRRGHGDRLSRAAMFGGVALPAFVLAVAVQRWAPGWLQNPTLASALIVGVNLFAVQTWVVRSEALQLVPEEFVKTLRASGAGDATVGRHVLRNAASPLLATFVSEVLVVLYVTVFVVEIVLGIPGLGGVGYAAFEQRDIGLILATVMLPVAVGLLSTLAKDVLTAFVDPRVSAGA
jgi:peptide/nickel transport system permease protein